MTELVEFSSPTGSFERAASAPTTPTETTKFQHQSKSLSLSLKPRKGRRVKFPTDDSIVTGYFEPEDPWTKDSSIDSLLAAYQTACEKQGVRPLPKIFKQLQSVTNFSERESELSLKGQRLDYKHVEALEEVFKRIQFNKIDLEGCSLDEEGAAALFDMIEYYESATFLNISFHKNIDSRGWQACSRMLKKTPCLQFLEIRNTNINEQMLLILGRALRIGSNLVSLNFENCGLTGRAIVVLVAAIKLNSTLKELYLAENKISSSDGIQLGNLLRTNTWLEIFDLSGNHLQDAGLVQIVDGLKEQADGPGDGLVSINLSNNHISHNGIMHLGKSLAGFRNLAMLNISNNSITDDGIHHLKPGLMASQTLKNLGLQNSKITCEGAVALAEVIADTKYIIDINLKENPIKVAGLMALSKSVKHNSLLQVLELDSASIKDFVSVNSFEEHKLLLNEIAEFCQRNKETSKQDQALRKNGLSSRFEQSEIALPPILQSNSEHEKTLVKSASTPVSRFKVSRVVLEKGMSDSLLDSSDIKTLSSSAPAEMTTTHLQKSLDNLKNQLASLNGVISQQTQLPRTTYAGNYDHTQKPQKAEFEDSGVSDVGSLNDQPITSYYDELPPLASNTITMDEKEMASTKPNKSSKKLSFVLPETPPSTLNMRKDRRMSTPAMPIAAKSLRRPNPLKLCKALESLDLRSCVPLSPTRLYEGWVFPEPPVEFKHFQEEKEEACWNPTHSPTHCV